MIDTPESRSIVIAGWRHRQGKGQPFGCVLFVYTWYKMSNESQELKAFADRLREERLRAKLSQPALGKIGGVNKATKSGYEAGHHKPDAVYLARIDRHGIDACYLLTGRTAAVRAGQDMNWELVEDLVTVLEQFEERRGSRLAAPVKVRLLRVLYAASVGSGRADPLLVEAVLRDAA